MNERQRRLIKIFLLLIGIVIVSIAVKVALLYGEAWKADKHHLSTFSSYSQRVAEKYCQKWALSSELRKRRDCCLESIQLMDDRNGKLAPFFRNDAFLSSGCREGSASILMSCRGSIDWCGSDDGRLPIITLENADIESQDIRTIERNRNIIEDFATGYGEPKDTIAIMIVTESEHSVTGWVVFRYNKNNNGRFQASYFDADGRWHVE